MDIEKILKNMTLQEKAAICSGKDFWTTKNFDHHGIPSVMMTDGPHGLRKQETEAEVDHLGIKPSKKSVCFPAGCALASSFDEDLIYNVGRTLGRECQAEDIAMILGPGVNIKRSPLCGRNFEYYSEDPYLAGKLGTAIVQGIQDEGVSACVKHYAVNNQETLRMSGDSVIDERTLHEIYLTPYEMIIKKAKLNAIMCAYNRVNGIFCAENKYLLTDVLRKRWGFDGFVVTDWGAVKDAAKGVEAGLDLIMPGGNESLEKRILSALQSGELTEEKLNAAAYNILKFIAKTLKNRKEGVIFNREEDYKVAADAAKECAVLLKNKDSLLPLHKNAKVAFIGEYAEKPRYQGSGSSNVNSAKVVNALTAAEGLNITYSQGYVSKSLDVDKKMMEDAVQAAKAADVAVLFVGLPDDFETEGADRDSLDMPNNQNALISAVTEVQKNTVVVLHNGSPVTMPWLDKVSAVLELYLAGDGAGEAAVSVLFGDTNPSGKLTETFPKKLSDTPSYLNFPGERGIVNYNEGVFVGYRYYDKKEIDVLFPFGHGLSYTTFEYSDLKLDKSEIKDTEKLTITFTVKNTGKYFGKEVAQIYVKDVESTVNRPLRELKAFKKVALNPGEQKRVSVLLEKRAFSYYETKVHDFFTESGEFIIEVGSSSRDIRLSAPIYVTSEDLIPIIFDRNSTMAEINASPKARAIMAELKKNLSSQSFQGAEGAQSLGEGSSKMVQRMIIEFTLGGLSSFMGLSDETLDNLIAALNS